MKTLVALSITITPDVGPIFFKMVKHEDLPSIHLYDSTKPPYDLQSFWSEMMKWVNKQGDADKAIGYFNRCNPVGSLDMCYGFCGKIRISKHFKDE